jgi:hypothetical protein
LQTPHLAIKLSTVKNFGVYKFLSVVKNRFSFVMKIFRRGISLKGLNYCLICRRKNNSEVKR